MGFRQTSQAQVCDEGGGPKKGGDFLSQIQEEEIGKEAVLLMATRKRDPYKWRIRSKKQTRRTLNSILGKATNMWSGDWGQYRSTMTDKDYNTIDKIVKKYLKELDD